MTKIVIKLGAVIDKSSIPEHTKVHTMEDGTMKTKTIKDIVLPKDKIAVDKINNRSVSFRQKNVVFRILIDDLGEIENIDMGNIQKRGIGKNNIDEFNKISNLSGAIKIGKGETFYRKLINSPFIEQYVPSSMSYAKVPTDVLQYQKLSVFRINTSSISITNEDGALYRIKLKNLTGCIINPSVGNSVLLNEKPKVEKKKSVKAVSKDNTTPKTNSNIPDINAVFYAKEPSVDRSTKILLYNSNSYSYIKTLTIENYEKSFGEAIYQVIRHTKNAAVVKSSVHELHIIYMPFSAFKGNVQQEEKVQPKENAQQGEEKVETKNEIPKNDSTKVIEYEIKTSIKLSNDGGTISFSGNQETKPLPVFVPIKLKDATGNEILKIYHKDGTVVLPASMVEEVKMEIIYTKFV